MRGLWWIRAGTAVLMLAACSNLRPSASPASFVGNEIDRALETITPQDLYDRIAYLASDTMRGRNTPSPGLEAAATYVADQLRTFGLRPAGDSGSFVQRWPFRQSRLDLRTASLQVRTADSTFQPALATDYFVIPGRESSMNGTLHWGGAADAAMTASWSKGRVPVVYLAGTTPDSAWNARIAGAFAAAMNSGAPAVVIVFAPTFDNALFRQIAAQAGGEETALHLIGMRYAAAAPILASAGADTAALRAGRDIADLALDNATLSVAIGRTTQESRPPNVVGILGGSDPELRDEYVVVSAHIDHIGTGRPDVTGDSIFNGADDDASGTAVMLEIAQAFAGLRSRPLRSLLFLAVSGEEKGLLGSAWFTRNLPVPVESIVANINLDMVGRNAPDTIAAIGHEYSSLGPLASSVAVLNPSLGLTVAADPWPEEQLFFRSDHFNFARIGVPALFFTTGLHAQYHQPSDEVDLIDTDKITRIARFLFRVTLEIATTPDRPTWTEEGRRAIGR